MELINNINYILQKEAIVQLLKGKVERINQRIIVGGTELPRSLENKLLKRCNGYENMQEAIDRKNIYLRGREISRGQETAGIEWFGLVTDEFKPFSLEKIRETVEQFAKDVKVRYLPQKERFFINCEVDSVPQKLNVLIDSGDYGVYGGNGESALRCGASIFDFFCTNWTLFLQYEAPELNPRKVHRQSTPNFYDIFTKQIGFLGEIKQKWEESKNIVFERGTVEAYIDAYTSRMNGKRFFHDILGQIGAETTVYDFAYKITKQAQELKDFPRARMEMLAGELILCPEQIREMYAKNEEKNAEKNYVLTLN